MSDRPPCACGCGDPLEGRRSNVTCATPACRQRVWKAKTGYSLHAVQKASLRRRSGLQPSYPKAVEAVARALQAEVAAGLDLALDLDACRAWAESALRDALSDRQRAQLDKRSAT